MVLVIGGTGFLGAHLLKALVDSGEEVRCTHRKRLLKYVPLKVATSIDWQPADIFDAESLDNAMQGVDQVFHCAGMVSFVPEDSEMVQKVNVEGTANVVNSCIRNQVKKLVHVSSVAALGRASSRKIIDETCQWEDSPNNTAYARSKHEAEMEVWRGMGEGLKIVIVNPSILIGTSLSWDKGSLKLFSNLYNGFSWYTKGVNGFVDVDDVASAMVSLMKSEISEERFILNGDNWPYQQLFFAIKRALKIETKLKYANPWMSELVWRMERVRKYFTGKEPSVTREMAKTANLQVYYDNSKIKRFLPGFEFTPLEKTVANAGVSFLQQKERQEKGLNVYEEIVTSKIY